jgi:hypothetical protein
MDEEYMRRVLEVRSTSKRPKAVSSYTKVNKSKLNIVNPLFLKFVIPLFLNTFPCCCESYVLFGHRFGYILYMCTCTSVVVSVQMVTFPWKFSF